MGWPPSRRDLYPWIGETPPLDTKWHKVPVTLLTQKADLYDFLLFLIFFLATPLLQHLYMLSLYLLLSHFCLLSHLFLIYPSYNKKTCGLYLHLLLCFLCNHEQQITVGCDCYMLLAPIGAFPFKSYHTMRIYC